MQDVKSLYVEIGKSLSKSAMGVEPSHDDFEERGKNWFDQNRVKLSAKVCCDNVKARLDVESDEQKMVTIIADALGAIILYVPVATVSRLVVRLGVYKFCGWERSS